MNERYLDGLDIDHGYLRRVRTKPVRSSHLQGVTRSEWPFRNEYAIVPSYTAPDRIRPGSMNNSSLIRRVIDELESLCIASKYWT